jgi:hypothetical protein
MGASSFIHSQNVERVVLAENGLLNRIAASLVKIMRTVCFSWTAKKKEAFQLSAFKMEPWMGAHICGNKLLGHYFQRGGVC